MIDREELILRFMSRPKYTDMVMGHSQPVRHKPVYPNYEEAESFADAFIAMSTVKEEDVMWLIKDVENKSYHYTDEAVTLVQDFNIARLFCGVEVDKKHGLFHPTKVHVKEVGDVNNFKTNIWWAMRNGKGKYFEKPFHNKFAEYRGSSILLFASEESARAEIEKQQITWFEPVPLKIREL